MLTILSFFFNNKFYFHIRNNQLLDINVRLSKIVKKFVDLRKIFTIIVYVNTNFSIKIIKVIFDVFILIIIFDVDLFKNINIDYYCRD